MPNKSGNAYGLSVLCPLKDVDAKGQSVKVKLRDKLLAITSCEDSPMSKVPNTYLARFYILDDVVFEDYPHALEHLKSSYLVFTTNFHGQLDDYLKGMYNAISEEIKNIWEDAFGFDKESLNVEAFVKYIKKCQVETTFFFNGSTDDSLELQLKSLYLKQEFSKFVFENTHKSDEEIQEGFKQFVKESNPDGNFPTWRAGAESLDRTVITE